MDDGKDQVVLELTDDGTARFEENELVGVFDKVRYWAAGIELEEGQIEETDDDMGRLEVVDMVGLEGIGEGRKGVGKVPREVADIVVEHQGMQFAEWEDIGYIE